jgi:hypothetical protein
MSDVRDSVQHVCKRDRTCRCSVIGLEPDDNCPIHGCGEWPPRCGECGRYITTADVVIGQETQ